MALFRRFSVIGHPSPIGEGWLLVCMKHSNRLDDEIFRYLLDNFWNIMYNQFTKYMGVCDMTVELSQYSRIVYVSIFTILFLYLSLFALLFLC